MSACQCEDRPCCGCDSYAAEEGAATEWRGYDDPAAEWDEEGDGEWAEG